MGGGVFPGRWECPGAARIGHERLPGVLAEGPAALDFHTHTAPRVGCVSAAAPCNGIKLPGCCREEAAENSSPAQKAGNRNGSDTGPETSWPARLGHPPPCRPSRPWPSDRRMGCGASAAAGAKYSDPADPTAARKPESAGQQATGAHSEGVPAPAGADEAQEQKGSAGLGSNFTTPSFERRAGWVDIERPPLDKKLQPEWCARWLVVRGRQLQVFRQDPARQRPASRGFFQKERALIEPVRTLSLPDSELKKLARSEISEGRANAFLLGPREGEDEDREAAIDAAFTAPTAMPRAAKKSKKGEHNVRTCTPFQILIRAVDASPCQW
eukprot:COSAG05_NODE_1664_length_4313_cov_152.642145_2_plen_327_part_00